MRLLVVEDEPGLRVRLAERLRHEGYAVDVAEEGDTALYHGKEYPLDGAVLDVGLPGLDGIEVLRRWRQAGCDFPVLILTARGKWEEKVAGLEAGADDYLVKPFHFAELLARVRALLRRSAGWSHDAVKCGPVVLEQSRRAVSVDGMDVELTAFEYRVLEYLMLHSGQVLSKQTITEHVYEEHVDRDSNVLEVLIARLRRKLDPDKTLNPIETVRGQGYMFRLQRCNAADVVAE